MLGFASLVQLLAAVSVSSRSHLLTFFSQCRGRVFQRLAAEYLFYNYKDETSHRCFYTGGTKGFI